MHALIQARAVLAWMRNLKAGGVRVGITNEGGRSAVERALQQTGIPTDAVLIEITESSVPYYTPTLRSRISPHTAGSEIEYQTPDYPSGEAPCTYGWNVSWEGRRHMLVNAHCTDEFGGPYVATAIFQPRVPTWNYQSADYKVGNEVQDPDFRTDLYGCASSLAPLGCRYADVALVEIRDTNRDWDLGGVLRTQSRTMLPSYYGTLQIDLGRPTFEMSGVLSSLFVGDTVNKVGRTTGWTAGVVESACRNIFYDGRGYLCSGVVQGPAGRGDSGSPVFWTAADGRQLVVGILFSGSPNYDNIVGDNFNFSHWSYIDYELGQPAVNDLTVFESTNTSPAFSATEMPADGSEPPPDCTSDPSLPC
ncbi:MAG: S1 family peptidase [Gemmatimonadota bacterium]|nr:S1 family peptidase [Gemmatimonadota bacterium]